MLPPLTLNNLPRYAAGTEALFGLARLAMGAVPPVGKTPGSPPAAPPATPPATPPTVPAFVATSLTRLSPIYIALVGGVAFLALVSFDNARRLRRVEQALARRRGE